MKLSATQSSKQMDEMVKQQTIMVEAANKLLNVSNKTLENEKKTTQEKKKQRKQDEGNKSYVDEWMSDRQNNQQSKETANAILDAIKGNSSFSSVMLSKNNKSKDDIISRMRDIENSNMTSIEKRSEMNGLIEQFNSLDKSAGKIQAAATVLDTGAKALRKTIQIWSDRFFSGMERIINTYEDTFQDQAVMTGISQQEYFDYQNNEAKKLNDLGLQNNIAMSKVMTATSQFVNKGITNFAEASEMGQTAAIGKVLAPYLDQQSEAFISLFMHVVIGFESYALSAIYLKLWVLSL